VELSGSGGRLPEGTTEEPRWPDVAEAPRPGWGQGIGSPAPADARRPPPASGQEVPARGALNAGEPRAERDGGGWPSSYWWPEPDGRAGAGAATRATASRATTGRQRPVGGPGQRGKSPSTLRRAWQRLIATLAAVGAFLAKFGALLIKLKYVGLVVSMLASVLAYTLFFGWSFAVGFVLLIFVHEMGHVVVLRRQGVPASAPLFIPFLGAFVNMRQMPRNAYQEAVSGLAGPYFGTAASAAVAIWGHAAGSNFLLRLGAVGFLINLFNLLPVLPLDGGRAAAALHPVLWLVGLFGLLVWEFYNPSPIALVILVLGGFELYRRWTRRNSPAARAYHALAANQRWAVAALYVLVVAIAVAGFQLTYVARSL
jgi:Zn-dependent protease